MTNNPKIYVGDRRKVVALAFMQKQRTKNFDGVPQQYTSVYSKNSVNKQGKFDPSLEPDADLSKRTLVKKGGFSWPENLPRYNKGPSNVNTGGAGGDWNQVVDDLDDYWAERLERHRLRADRGDFDHIPQPKPPVPYYPGDYMSPWEDGLGDWWDDSDDNGDGGGGLWPPSDPWEEPAGPWWDPDYDDYLLPLPPRRGGGIIIGGGIYGGYGGGSVGGPFCTDDEYNQDTGVFTPGVCTPGDKNEWSGGIYVVTDLGAMAEAAGGLFDKIVGAFQ